MQNFLRISVYYIMSEEPNAWQTRNSSIIQWSATFHNREAENTEGSETESKSGILPRSRGVHEMTSSRVITPGFEQAFLS